jgi:hypothetical protein
MHHTGRAGKVEPGGAPGASIVGVAPHRAGAIIGLPLPAGHWSTSRQWLRPGRGWARRGLTSRGGRCWRGHRSRGCDDPRSGGLYQGERLIGSSVEFLLEDTLAKLPQVELETGPQRPPIPVDERVQLATPGAMLHSSDVPHGVEMMGEQVRRQVLDPAAIEIAILLTIEEPLGSTPFHTVSPIPLLPADHLLIDPLVVGGVHDGEVQVGISAHFNPDLANLGSDAEAELRAASKDQVPGMDVRASAYYLVDPVRTCIR